MRRVKPATYGRKLSGNMETQTGESRPRRGIDKEKR
jgi:hypothetical protein